ncbi:MAG TPA: RluA family pseudouridine synthase [Candidatus Pullichristensenella avicola]|nr:RluA family pseudouridine synthase [Candidatus Pullichristensenella avicola]
MAEILSWRVAPEDAGQRLDAYITARAEITRSRVGRLIEEGQCALNGAAATKAGARLRAGDEVRLSVPEAREATVEAQDIALRILYEDDDLAVVYKPSGMVAHPAAGNPDGTLVNALLYHLDGLSGVGGEKRPGLVHRIDKDTSGLLLVAKNDRAHLALAAQIQEHSVERAYLAVCIGHFKEAQGVVDAPIGRHPTDRKKMAIRPDGRRAVTHWRVLEPLRGASYVEARLETGRTHQIRVHMASLGHPVLGDPVYGPKKSPYPVLGGQLLHAAVIGFDHPSTGERMRFEAPPEPRFSMWLERLKMR